MDHIEWLFNIMQIRLKKIITIFDGTQRTSLKRSIRVNDIRSMFFFVLYNYKGQSPNKKCIIEQLDSE